MILIPMRQVSTRRCLLRHRSPTLPLGQRSSALRLYLRDCSRAPYPLDYAAPNKQSYEEEGYRITVLADDTACLSFRATWSPGRATVRGLGGPRMKT